MLAEIPAEEFTTALDDVAAELLQAAHAEGPPFDMFHLARCLGITMAWDDRQQVRGRYVRLTAAGAPSPTILLRPDPRGERCQWAVAHEIGEHAAQRVFALLAVDPRVVGPRGREEVANRLAGRLLLPSDCFQRDATSCGWDLAALKKKYATASHELIARRMLEQNPPVIITIFDHARVSFRQSNVPGRVPPLAAVESDCWRVVHEANRPDSARRQSLAVQGWPVHEPGWKREILRTEVEQELLREVA